MLKPATIGSKLRQMKNVKINLDRPQIDSKSIQTNKDFDGLMKNHAVMSKPFYKSPWFFGTTGLASIGIVAGIVAYNYDDAVHEPDLTTDAPPELTVESNNIIAFNDQNPKTLTHDLVKETFKYSNEIQKDIDDNNSTLDQSESNSNENIQENSDDQTTEIVNQQLHIDQHKDNSDKDEFLALLPKIGGKANGSITKDELFDNKGITTESDVNVIHFELHLIDGLGGKVFEEESNQLNDEMKDALKKITSGETIYFENIKGKTENGDIVRLNPLRYVLMN